MVRVYYLGDNGEELSPLDASDLVPLGLEYHKLNPQDYDEDLAQIKQKNGYTFHDIIHCDPDHLPDFETKIRYFAEEHLHRDDEVRFFIEGCGFFDVRSKDDKWIRLSLEAGDLISLPAGIYHRFIVNTECKSCKVMRLFQGEPVWTPYNRALPETENDAARKKYLELVKK